MTDHNAMFFHQDPDFMRSHEGRDVRVLSEFMGPMVKFRKYGIDNTIAFFGSARTLPSKEVAKALKKAIKSDDPLEIKRLKRLKKMGRFYDDTRELARRLSEWSKHHNLEYAICTGGGPGIMEAGNRGAADVNAPNIGLNIELPFEQSSNPYITPELNMNFNYFFIRKYWFLYMVKALVAFPGGFGTMDELFETLTLVQTKKMVKPIPVVLFGKKYWNQLVDWDLMVETGMINEEDLSLFKIIDTVDEAYEYLTKELMDHAEEFKILTKKPGRSNLFEGKSK